MSQNIPLAERKYREELAAKRKEQGLIEVDANFSYALGQYTLAVINRYNIENDINEVFYDMMGGGNMPTLERFFDQLFASAREGRRRAGRRVGSVKNRLFNKTPAQSPTHGELAMAVESLPAFGITRASNATMRTAPFEIDADEPGSEAQPLARPIPNPDSENNEITIPRGRAARAREEELEYLNKVKKALKKLIVAEVKLIKKNLIENDKDPTAMAIVDDESIIDMEIATSLEKVKNVIINSHIHYIKNHGHYVMNSEDHGFGSVYESLENKDEFIKMQDYIEDIKRNHPEIEENWKEIIDNYKIAEDDKKLLFEKVVLSAANAFAGFDLKLNVYGFRGRFPARKKVEKMKSIINDLIDEFNSLAPRKNVVMRQFLPDELKNNLRVKSKVVTALGGKRKRRTRRNKKYNKKSKKHHKKRSYKKRAKKNHKKTHKKH